MLNNSLHEIIRNIRLISDILNLHAQRARVVLAKALLIRSTINSVIFAITVKKLKRKLKWEAI